MAPAEPKRRWWPGGGWQHGDAFPLPVPTDIFPSGAPRYVRRRWRERQARQRLYRDCVDSLNQLAAATSNSNHFRREAPSRASPTSVQATMLHGVHRRIASYGDAPPDLTPSGALQELLKTKDLYGQEPRHLASYSADKLRIVRAGVTPKDARGLLPPEAAARLRNFRSTIELSAEEIADIHRDRRMPRPYWDPTLASDRRQRHELFRRLLELGVLTVRRRIKGRVGIFFVRKKENAIRLIVDARYANACHRRPPHTALGSASALSELSLAEYADLTTGELGSTTLPTPGVGPVPALDFHQSGCDVRDGFYQFAITELASWFGIDEKFTAGELGVTSCYDDDAEREVPLRADERVYLCVLAMPMGWSWALHFCQEAVSGCAVAASGGDPALLLRERQPAPKLTPGIPLHAVYVDNHTGLGHSANDARAAHEKFVAACESLGLGLHEEVPATRDLEALGVVFDGGDRTLRHRSLRVWRFRLATRALLARTRVRGAELEVWLGHAVHLCSLARPLLSVLSQVYSFVFEHRLGSAILWRGVRREMWMMHNLVFLAEVRLDQPYNPEVYLGDSSSYGYALMSTLADGNEIEEEFRWRERWRLVTASGRLPMPFLESERLDELFGIPAPPNGNDSENFIDKLPTVFAEVAVRGKSAEESAGSRTDYGRWVRKRIDATDVDRRPDARHFPPDKVESPTALPAPAGRWDTRDRWRTIIESEWDWNEHINVKEARVCLMGLRRALRTSRGCNRRLLTFTDNLVSAFVFDRGRSKSWALNALCRRAAALQLGGSVSWRCRHLATDRNHADEGSRRREYPRDKSTTSTSRATLALASSAPPPGLGCRVNLLGQARAPATGRRSRKIEPGGEAQSGCSGRRCKPACVVEPLRWPEHDRASPHPREPPPAARRLDGPGDRAFLELFAGSARLTRALRADGLRVLPPLEITDNPAYNLASRAVQKEVLGWVRSGRLWYVHLGTPCSAWSVARTHIRNSARASRLDAISVDLAIFSAELMRECARCGVLFSLENPASSRIFSFEPIASLGNLPDARYITFHLCGFGETVKKPTTLFTNAVCLDQLARGCDGSHKHGLLAGPLKSGAYSLGHVERGRLPWPKRRPRAPSATAHGTRSSSPG